MAIHKAVIPAAGLGTRLRPLTNFQAKEMLPVGQKPVIQYVLEDLQTLGITQVLIITSKEKHSLEMCLDHLPLSGIQIFYVHQIFGPEHHKGLAVAIALSEAFIDNEPFVVCLGDSIIKAPEPASLLKRMIGAHIQHSAIATVAFEQVPWEHVSRYGIADPVEEGEIFELRTVVEKPSEGEAPSNLAIAGQYIFDPGIFNFISTTPLGCNGEYQITDSIKLAIELDGNPVMGVMLQEEIRYDIGNIPGYYKAFYDFATTDPEYGEQFKEMLYK